MPPASCESSRAASSRRASRRTLPGHGIAACGSTASNPRRRGATRCSIPGRSRIPQEQLGELLPVARAEMESLYEQIAGSSFAVILSDTRGTVLSTITDPTLQREFRHAGLSIGAPWDERHEGTNGIGTCIAEGAPVTVHREEHFRGYNLSLVLLGGADTRSAGFADRRAGCFDRQLQRQPLDPAPHDGSRQHVGELDFALELHQRVRRRVDFALP